MYAALKGDMNTNTNFKIVKNCLKNRERKKNNCFAVIVSSVQNFLLTLTYLFTRCSPQLQNLCKHFSMQIRGLVYSWVTEPHFLITMSILEDAMKKKLLSF